MIRAAVSKATAASHEIVAAKSGYKIRLHGYLLVAAGAVNVTWQSASTALTGAMTMATGVPNSSPPANSFDSLHPLETAYGEALNLLLSGAVQVSGWIVFDYVVG